jgi:hypothetical protein
MLTSISNTNGPDPFALASTHVNKGYTLAIVFRCSVGQMNRVGDLLQQSEGASKYPPLMLGICAELHLDRLEKLVDYRVIKCAEATRLLSEGIVTWDLIDTIRKNRDKSARAREEVMLTYRQLLKALPFSCRPDGRQIWDKYADKELSRNASDSGSMSLFKENLMDIESESLEEATQMFADRFSDILGRFEGLIAECKISVEEMSFTADIVGYIYQILESLGTKRPQIRSELAGQATIASEGEAAKSRTSIALAGMVYLPMTTLAVLHSSHVLLTYPNLLDRQYLQCQSSNFRTIGETYDTST